MNALVGIPSVQHPAFDASRYPRTYRPGIVWRLSGTLFAAFLILGAVILFDFAARSDAHAAAAWIVLGLVCLAAAAFIVGVVLKYQLRLEPDAISIRCFRMRRWLRQDVLGCRRHGRGILVVLEGWPRRHVSLAVSMREYVDFRAWFDSLPDYDPDAVQEAKAAIDAALGATPAERIAKIRRGRRISYFFWGLMLAAASWGWFYPRPYDMAMIALAALPWLLVGIEQLSPLRRLYGPGKPASSIAVSAVIVSAIGLVMPTPASLSGLHLHGWEAALAIAILGGAVFTLAFAVLEIRWRTTVLLLPIVFLGASAYAYGAAFAANVFLDRSRPEVFTADVVGKRVSRGRPRTKWIVRLGPSEWGDPMNELLVPPQLYESIEPGGTVCVLLRPGALGIAWFTLEACGR